MSSSGASGASARSGDSDDGTDVSGSGSERTSDDGNNAGGSNGGQVDDDTISTVGEHNNDSSGSSSSRDGAQSQHDSEGEEGAPSASDAEDTASEREGRVTQEDTDAEDADSNHSGRGGATDGSSDASEHSSDGGTENNDNVNNSSRRSSDNKRASRRRRSRGSGEESETEVRRETGRRGASKSRNSSSGDSDDDSRGKQNEEGDETSFPPNDEAVEHSERAKEDDLGSEGQQSRDEEEHFRRGRSDGEDTGDDEQSDGDVLVRPDQQEEATAARMIQRKVRSRTNMQPRHKAATKIQATARGRHARRNRSKIDPDDDDDDNRWGEGDPDREEEATAARMIQRRVRGRAIKARAGREKQPRHKAATKIQATARGRHARRSRFHRDRSGGTKIDHDDNHDDDRGGESGSDWEEKATAARRIQRRVRGRATKARADRDKQPRHKAATKIQATARGRHARRNHRSRLKSVSSDGESPRREEASTPGTSDRADDDDDYGDELFKPERDCTSTSGLNLTEGKKLLEQHAARRIQRHARRSLLGGEKATRTQISSKPSAEFERKYANRDTGDGLRSRRVPTKPPECDTRGAARRGTGNRDRQVGAGESGGLGKDAAARRIQMKLGRQHGRRSPKEDRMERKHDGARRSEAGESDGRLPAKADRVKAGQHPPTSTARTEMNIRGHRLHPERATKDVQLELAVEHPGAPQQQQQQQQQQQTTGFVSPGKAAAAAASAVAKSAAAAAAAAVRTAEAAADAAEAAEAAAEAEDEWSPSVIISSPPIGRESRRKHSPARSAFWLTEGDDKEQSPEQRDAGNMTKSRPYSGDSGTVGGAREGVDGGGRKRSPRHARGHAGVVGDRGSRGEVGGSGSASEDAKLKHAREQAKRHARDRRARAMAKEEDSRRELRAVHADLVKAEELRNKQANVEKSALEAKRSRVLEDMNRRQQRLRRLQQDEEALLDRGGHSHRRNSSSRSPSADAAVEPKPTRLGSKPKRIGGDEEGGDDLVERTTRDEGGTFSLPRIAGGGDEGRQRRRKPRHVSTFRERILEERRARKEVDALKRKELEEKHSRQAEYAAKIRAQAKRALAGEQRRAQEDADRSARAHRTPIAIKRPKQEGEWGVYSYPPDRPPDGFAATKGRVDHGGGAGRGGGSDRRHVPGYGSTGRVRDQVGSDRLGSSELRDRMRRERARATDASRARAAEARAAAVEAEVTADGGSGSRGYGSSADGSGGRRRRRTGFGRDVGSNIGDGVGGNRRAEEEGGHHYHHRPAPPRERRAVEERLGCGQARSDDVNGGGGRKLGVARSGTRSGGGGGGGGGGPGGAPGPGGGAPNPQRRRPADDNNREAPDLAPQRPPAGDNSNNIHAMYEKRLAALERRLVRASSGSRSFPERGAAGGGRGGGGGSAVGSDSSVGIERRGGGEGTRTRKSAMPLRGEEEWGTENNPFGYRESSVEDGRGGFARTPDYGRAVNGGESTSGREVEVEGLSTMYMGPISHKMARLRASNKV